MARILMANIPAYGHVNPTLPVAAALVEAGHEVGYALTEHFRTRVERTGATLLPYGGGIDVDPVDRRSVLRNARRLYTGMNAAIVDAAPGYDVVVAGGMNPCVPWLERRLEVPVVFLTAIFLQNERTLAHFADICLGLPRAVRVLMRHRRPRLALSRVLTPRVFGVRLPDLLGIFGPQSGTLNLVMTSRFFQPYPEDFDGFPVAYVGPTPTVSGLDDTFPLDRLRDHAGPVVYATLGTVFNDWPGFFRAVAEAFAGSDALVVMSTGHPDRIAAVGPVPDNVVLRPFVPQAAVLAHADLCIAHAGFGSLSDAVSLGVPMICVPVGADHFFNAYRLRELGAGEVLPNRKVTPGRVRRLAESILSSRDRGAGFDRLRDSFLTAGGPARAVREIEAVLAR